MQEKLRETIDLELCSVKMSDEMKKNVSEHVFRRKPQKYYRIAVASLAVLLFSGTTAFAGYSLLNKVHVNQAVLPALDEMQKVTMNEPDMAKDEYGMFEDDFTDYSMLKEKLGISLLDTELATNNPHMLGRLFSDGTDFCILTVENYILGDTGAYQYLENENRYEYTKGAKYTTPITLNVDIALSDEQLKNGWDTDYLGMYEFVENFKSEQGYPVNLIQSTNGSEELPEGAVSEKCAIFVADGVRYTLKGRVSVETMKEIINTMN